MHARLEFQQLYIHTCKQGHEREWKESDEQEMQHLARQMVRDLDIDRDRLVRSSCMHTRIHAYLDIDLVIVIPASTHTYMHTRIHTDLDIDPDRHVRSSALELPLYQALSY